MLCNNEKLSQREETQLRHSLQRCREKVEAACVRVGRSPKEVRVVLATKTQSAHRINIALEEGFVDFGENRLQEAEEKLPLVGVADRPEPVWHFIGRLQRNKAANVVRFCRMVHSVDRLALAERLAAEVSTTYPSDDTSSPHPRDKLDILLQVNTSGEATKAGHNIAEIPAFAEQVSQLTPLRICGLMTLAAPSDNERQSRMEFARLRRLASAIDDLGIPRVSMQHLSMGTSGDFASAIAEGSTMVRLGSVAFSP